MAGFVDLASLIVASTKEVILQKAIDVCSSLGLTTEAWEAGDPTRSYLYSTSARFADWEGTGADPNAPVSGGGIPAIIKGGFLGLAAGDWLTNLLYWNYGVTRNAATYATTTIRLTNNGSANIGAINPNDVTAGNTITKATYRNTTGGTLGPGPGTFLDLTFLAEVAGSGGNAGIGDITTLVVAIPNVTITNLTAATGLSLESDAAATIRGQAKLGSLSPNGPAQAPAYVILTPSLQSDGSGVTNITRTRVLPDSNTGLAYVYVATTAGAPSGPDVTRAQNTVIALAEPLCITVTVLGATGVTIPITYSLWVYDSINLTTAQIQATVAAYLAQAFATHAIGGDAVTPGTQGYIYQGWIQAQILAAVSPHGFRCTVSAPAADVPLALNVPPAGVVAEVGVLGAITPTVTILPRPR